MSACHTVCSAKFDLLGKVVARPHQCPGTLWVSKASVGRYVVLDQHPAPPPTFQCFEYQWVIPAWIIITLKSYLIGFYPLLSVPQFSIVNDVGLRIFTMMIF